MGLDTSQVTRAVAEALSPLPDQGFGSQPNRPYRIWGQQKPIVLQVRNVRYYAELRSLVEVSDYFRNLVACNPLKQHFPSEYKWVAGEALAINVDPAVFANIIDFANNKTYPLFYKDHEGFDRGRYAALYQVCQEYGVRQLGKWIQESGFEKAVKISHKMDKMNWWELEREFSSDVPTEIVPVGNRGEYFFRKRPMVDYTALIATIEPVSESTAEKPGASTSASKDQPPPYSSGPGDLFEKCEKMRRDC